MLSHKKIIFFSGVLIFAAFILNGCGTTPATTPTPPLSPEIEAPTTTPSVPTSTEPTVQELSVPAITDVARWKKFKSGPTAHLEMLYPTSLKEDTNTPSTTFVSLRFPTADYKGTNLTDTKVTLEFTKDGNEESCLINYNTTSDYLSKTTTNTQGAKISKILNNNLTWFHSTLEDAGAGSINTTHAYELFAEQKCYRLTLALRASNGTGDTTTTLKQFDPEPFVTTFNQIVSTFKFTTTTTSTASTTLKATTITLADNNKTINLKAGSSVLINLGATTYDWKLAENDSNILSLVKNAELVKGAQALYKVDTAGETDIAATGEPTCFKSNPPCANPSLEFKVHLIVK